MTTIELARDSTADRTQPDDRRVSALWWVVPTFLLWCGAIAWWLA